MGRFGPLILKILDVVCKAQVLWAKPFSVDRSLLQQEPHHLHAGSIPSHCCGGTGHQLIQGYTGELPPFLLPQRAAWQHQHQTNTGDARGAQARHCTGLL